MTPRSHVVIVDVRSHLRAADFARFELEAEVHAAPDAAVGLFPGERVEARIRRTGPETLRVSETHQQRFRSM